MRFRNLLITLLIGITVAVAAAFALVLTGNQGPSTPSNPSSTPPGATPPPRITPRQGPTIDKPPTIDRFGNRLEDKGTEEGLALPQDPAARSAPSRPDYLAAVPARMQWQRGWGGAALPISGSDGPAHIRTGVASGFAQTPQGAALAAYDALARALAAPDGVWQQVVAQRYHGGGQALQARFARARNSTPDAGQFVVVPEGFRVLPDYRNDFAVVQIATKAPGGSAYSTWPMTWTDGDWRVRVPEDIETLWAPATPVVSLIDFTSWKSMP
ncbi:hypothetical protein [Nocardia sp. XZ_19_385]|uniref:hypothetical protein n=1 Tax=Nocardia sp. XZ_19_385 TaxID=2769488 RepID=UPI00188E7B06|nr:hypothetical protein [Nocardia sp. XZ_19_385]